jgi:hypothetical protein
MKQILDLLKKKEEEPYMVKGDNGLPLWVLPLPSGINMDTEDNVDSELHKEKESNI